MEYKLNMNTKSMTSFVQKDNVKLTLISSLLSVGYILFIMLVVLVKAAVRG